MTDNREAFEAHYFRDTSRMSPARDRKDDDSYWNRDADRAWGHWQAAWTASRKLAMQEAASKLDLSPSALRLMAGEMTAGEVRTVQAVLNALAASLRKEARGE